MPINPNVAGTPMMGFSSPSEFYVGFAGSGTYVLQGLGWPLEIFRPSTRLIRKRRVAVRS